MLKETKKKIPAICLKRSHYPLLTILRFIFHLFEKPLMSASQKCIVYMSEFAYLSKNSCLNDSIYNC